MEEFLQMAGNALTPSLAGADRIDQFHSRYHPIVSFALAQYIFVRSCPPVTLQRIIDVVAQTGNQGGNGLFG